MLISNFDGNMYEILRSMKCKNREKIYSKKKITHKTVFTWFGNLPTSTELQRFHFFQGKIQSAAIEFSLFKKKK